MKRIQILLAASVIALAACKEKAAPESKAAEPAIQPAKQPQDAAAKPAFAAPDTFKSALGHVYEGYLGMQTALAQDDFEKAKAAFSSMHGLLHMMPKDSLDSSARAAWEAGDARMMEILHPMAASKDIAEFRSHFSEFSEAMTEAIENFGMSGNLPVYQMHCPMAKGDKGADWLQKDSTVANPYFGAAMPKCGERVRALKG